MGVHAGHEMVERGAHVVQIQPRVNHKVDAGSMSGGTHVNAAGPRNVGENLAEPPNMGWGIAEGTERQEQEGRQRQDGVEEDS